jgi:trehalose-6-phosphate synthase
MPRSERCARWEKMAAHLRRHSIHRWFASFLSALKSPEPNVLPMVPSAAVPSMRATGHDRELIA